MEITVKINSEPLDATLEKLVDACQNREPLMRNLSEQLHDCVMENFEQEGRPSWKPITREGKILQDTGRLKSSISPEYDNDSAKVGTNVVYAAIHQHGGKTSPHVIRPKHKKALAFGGRVVKSVNHPGSDIPARPFLSVTDEDIADLQETIEDYINNAIG